MQGHPQTVLIATVLVGLITIAPNQLLSHEVDHYNVPLQREWVDHGPYWNSLFYDAVTKATNATNQDILLAKKIPIASVRNARLAFLQHPSTITFRVRSNMPSAFVAIERLEMQYRLRRTKNQPDNLLVAHKPGPLESTFGHASLLPDPRQLSRMTIMRCSLIQVHGQKMGTDKIGHFIAMGYYYYVAYSASRAAGNSHEDALAQARHIGVDGPISEKGVVGMLPTGVISNADLVSNYVGMKFYLNVTQPVMLKGARYPPMVLRDGDNWKLQPHVNRDGPFFSAFVSQHYDEALNPSVFEPISRAQIRRVVRNKRDVLLKFYAGNDRAKMTPQYFREISRKLSKYYGEDYGHIGDADALIQLADVLFEGRRQLPRVVASKREPIVSVQAVGPQDIAVASERRFAIVVTNLTNSPITGLDVSAELPASVELRHLDETAEVDRQENEITWRLRYLEPRETKLLRFHASANTPGVVKYGARAALEGEGVIAHSQQSLRVRNSPASDSHHGTRVEMASGIPRQRIPSAGGSMLPILRR